MFYSGSLSFSMGEMYMHVVHACLLIGAMCEVSELGMYQIARFTRYWILPDDGLLDTGSTGY
jgi:hypothetical protein